MFLLLLTTLIISTAAQDPVEQTPYYISYDVADVPPTPNDLTSRSETQQGTPGDAITVVEFPFSGTVPEDDGAIFGELDFESTVQNGTLLARETVRNSAYGNDLYVVYNQSFAQSVRDVKIFNLGRERGFPFRARIHHDLGFVEAEILVRAEERVRILVETYG